MEKKVVKLEGVVIHGPIMEGAPVVFTRKNGDKLRTSPVQKICNGHGNSVSFETKNSVYQFVNCNFARG